MQIRDAILAAASHIERNPDLFDYSRNALPDCNTPGCAIGWIAYFRGLSGDFSACEKRDSIRAVGVPWGWTAGPTFIERMDSLHGDQGWRHDAGFCAATLRLYADAHHPATERTLQYPNWHAIATAPLDEADAADTLLRAAIKERRTA